MLLSLQLVMITAVTMPADTRYLDLSVHLDNEFLIFSIMFSVLSTDDHEFPDGPFKFAVFGLHGEDVYTAGNVLAVS